MLVELLGELGDGSVFVLLICLVKCLGVWVSELLCEFIVLSDVWFGGVVGLDWVCLYCDDGGCWIVMLIVVGCVWMKFCVDMVVVLLVILVFCLLFLFFVMKFFGCLIFINVCKVMWIVV